MTETNASAIYKVGDKVRIIAQAEGDCTSDAKIGGKAVILKEFDGMHYRVRYEANEGDKPTGWILPESVEKVADKPTKNQRISALEAQVSELVAAVEALKQAAERERAVKGTVAKYDGALRKLAEHKPALTPNELRKAIIAEARAFVAENLAKNHPDVVTTTGPGVWVVREPGVRITDKVEFSVNAEKRTVVALVRDIRYARKLSAKAIAKCAPGDVFNADIGKAIALGRALGLDVSKFEQAVQPTEKVIGQIAVNNTRSAGKYRGVALQLAEPGNYYSRYRKGERKAAIDSEFAESATTVITDDTEAQYE